MILFPCINTLFTVNLDGDVRTGDGAQGATVTVARFVLETDRPVSPGVVFMGRGDQAFLAGLDAEEAFLAKLPVDGNMSLQVTLLLLAAMTDPVAGTRDAETKAIHFESLMAPFGANRR
jgi:hypothetical protein